MRIDFSAPLFGPNGFPVPETDLMGANQATLAYFLRVQILGTQTKGEAQRLYGWCNKLAAEEALDLEPIDFKSLYEIIENSNAMVFVKGPLLNAMDAAKDASAKS
jgi:hypothetical protein